MVGKRSGKALREEGMQSYKIESLYQSKNTEDSNSGLERTDNNMDLTTWPQVNMINQKNYYT